jgi:hypothetical protein
MIFILKILKISFLLFVIESNINKDSKCNRKQIVKMVMVYHDFYLENLENQRSILLYPLSQNVLLCIFGDR